MLWNRHCSQDSTSTRSGSRTFTIESGGSGGERSDKGDCGDHHHRHRHRHRHQEEFESHISRSPTRKTTDCLPRSTVELTPGSPSITSGRGRRQGSRNVVSHRGVGFVGGNRHLEVSPSSVSAESGDSQSRDRGRQETDVVEDLPASLNSVAERDEELRSQASQNLEPSHSSVGGLGRLSEESLSPPAFTSEEVASPNEFVGEDHHPRGDRDHRQKDNREALRMPATGDGGGTSMGSGGLSDPATPSSHLANKAKEVEAAFSMTPMKRRMARMQMGWPTNGPGSGSRDATGHVGSEEMKWERHESPARPMSSSSQRSKLQVEEVDRSAKYPEKSDGSVLRVDPNSSSSSPGGATSEAVGETGKTSRISVMEGESEQEGVELVLKSEHSTPQRGTQGRGRVTNDDADRSPPPRRPRPLRPPPASSTDSADRQGEWSAPGHDPNSPSHHHHPYTHYSPDGAARQNYYSESGASHGPHHYYPRWTGRQQPYSPHPQHHYSPHQQHHTYHAPYSPPPPYTSAPPGSFDEKTTPNMGDPPPPGHYERHRRPPISTSEAQTSDVKIVSPPKDDDEGACPQPHGGAMGYHGWGGSHHDQYPHHGQPYYPAQHSPHHSGQSNYSPPRRQAHYQYPPSSPVRRNPGVPGGQEHTPPGVGPRSSAEGDGSREGQYDHRHPPQYGTPKSWWGGPSHTGSNASIVSESFDSNDRMSKDLPHSRGAGHYSPDRRSGGPPGGAPAIGSSPSWNYQHPPPHHGYGHHYPAGGDPHASSEDLSRDYVPPPYAHERHYEQTGYPLGSSGDEGDRQQHAADDTDHPLLRDYNPTKDRIPPSRSPLRRRGREVVILTPSSTSGDRDKGDGKGGKGSSPSLTPGSDDNTPITSNTSSSSSSALTRPAAASEINFEVTNPPMEPITPPSEEPVCTNPSLVNTHDVLFGRGGGTNTQVGNRRFRSLVQDFRNIYLMARRKEKPLIARSIVLIIRNRGGRFLKKDDVTGMMYEVGDEKAEAKTSQALREGLDVRATKSAANSLLRRNSGKEGGKDSKKGTKKKGGKEGDKSDDDDLSSKEDSLENPESGREGPPPPPSDRPQEGSHHEHRPPEAADGSGYYYPYGTHGDGANKRRRDGVGPPPPPGPYYPPPTYSSYPPYYYPPHTRETSGGPGPQTHPSHLQQSFSEEDSMVMGDFSPPRTKVPRPNSPDASSTQMHEAGTPPIRNIGTNSSSSGDGGPVHPPVPPPQHYPHMPPPQHYPPQQHPYYATQLTHPYHQHPHYTPPHPHGYHYHQHGSRPPPAGPPHHPPGPPPHGHHGGGSYKGYEGNTPAGGGNCSDTAMMATEGVSPPSKWSAV